MAAKPIEDLIATAVAQHDLDRDLHGWDPRLACIERNLADATPKEIVRRCRDLSILMIETGGAYGIGGAISARIKTALLSGDYEEKGEAEAILHRQGETSIEQAQDLTRVRRRIRDLEMLIMGRIRDLEQESPDARLLRVLGDFGADMTIQAIEAAIAEDHDAICDASIAWRNVHSNEPRLVVVPSTPRTDLEAALARLRTTGHAETNRGLFGAVRWTLIREPVRRRA